MSSSKESPWNIQPGHFGDGPENIHVFENFIDLEDCPKYTLTNLPKELLLEGRELTNNFDEKKYFNILNELFDYTKNNLTTKNLANYILSKI